MAASTSSQRTYRYLRLGIAGTVVVIFTSVGVAAATVGWLPSVSDYFYTPARASFVGALIAVSLALVALSGRGAERALLDAAALFAPLIALVPTTLAPGAIPGVVAPCAVRCFPPAYEGLAANGVVTYLIVGSLTVLVALLLAALKQLDLAAVGFSLIVTTAVLIVVAAAWLFARDAFLAQGHFVATIAFFGLFAAVAVINAFPRRGTPPALVFRVLYVMIAVALAAVLVAYIVLLPQADARGLPIVLIAEAAALSLFFAFWVVQGIEKWDDADPSIARG
ncbi:hypothetical protein [Microbacterium gallinarum]|uniref:DUF998 domain-containing protein n=1 Tax=Microbacterium gallinarum TaxID=2762209 RepID=A0ABR8X359_9MICO|nr:hypothetical protein [Microbacterium gallinarum]MBD8023762.1 hypothetical protein [Microbacterium gallinarum]